MLAHTLVFPRPPRLNAAGLGDRPRTIEVRYSFEDESRVEGPLGRMLQAQSGHEAPGSLAGEWQRDLDRSLGSIRAARPTRQDLLQHLRFVYLPAWRNPVDELRGERRAYWLNCCAHTSSASTAPGTFAISEERRRDFSRLLQRITSSRLSKSEFGRISALSSGVSRQWPYVRGQVVDDAYLARVFELMLAALEGRVNSRPLEVSGLGYVNLLHIAVTLAAIPDAAAIEASARAEPVQNLMTLRRMNRPRWTWRSTGLKRPLVTQRRKKTRSFRSRRFMRRS